MCRKVTLVPRRDDWRVGVNVSASVSSPDQAVSVAGSRAGQRWWFTLAGVAVIVASLLPPAGTLALRYVTAESVQFTVFAMVAPALIAAGAPWRLLRLSRAGAAGGAAGAGLLDQLAAVRQQQPSFLRAGIFLIAFMAATLLWRLPPVMDALVRQPALVVAELLTLLAAGLGLWLELVASPPLAPRLPRPQRAALSALAMWFIWAVAYVIGFHNGAVFSAYNVPGRAMSLISDQELAVVVMWAVAGFCFVPLVFSSMFGWLKDSDADEELQRFVRDASQRPVVKGWGPPVKGGGRPPRAGNGPAA